MRPDLTRVLKIVRERATCSSHFVWLEGEFEYFEGAGWLIAYRRVGKLALAALDPIETEENSDLELAIREWGQAACAQMVVFVATSSEMALRLSRLGFESIQIGREPWLKVPGYMPRGDTAKSVRAARNQAQRDGVWVEVFSGAQVAEDAKLRETLESIERAWRGSSVLQVDGFLMSTDIFRFAELRRYFVARTPGRIEGFLVASPIGGRNAAFLEDMFYLPDHARGVSELLVLEAIRSLESEGIALASLGIVTLTEVGPGPGNRPGIAMQKLLPWVARLLRVVYNAEGISLFRRRFGPTWSGIFLSARRLDSSAQATRIGVLSWGRIVLAVIRAHRPRLSISPRGWARSLAMRIRHFPLTMILAIVSTLSFVFVNRGGTLPQSVETALSFMPSAPIIEWPLRSLASDFLFESWGHFAGLLALTLLLVPGVERRYPRRFLFLFSGVTLLLDDIFDTIFVLWPFTRVRPDLHSRVFENADVGSSLLLMALLGLRIHAERRKRDWLFAAAVMGLVFALVLVHPHIDRFVLSLDHLLLLGFGYATAQIRLELRKRRSGRAG